MNPLTSYPGGQAAVGTMAGAPRELGVLERVDGISAGLSDLHEKLRHFGGRLAGDAPSNESAASPIAPGIAGTLSMAEARLRDCHQIVDALHKAF
jgi:hypothetical protein